MGQATQQEAMRRVTHLNEIPKDAREGSWIITYCA